MFNNLYLWLFPEIQRNREFYKTADVRPPFTYASLIRQVLTRLLFLELLELEFIRIINFLELGTIIRIYKDSNF